MQRETKKEKKTLIIKTVNLEEKRISKKTTEKYSSTNHQEIEKKDYGV